MATYSPGDFEFLIEKNNNFSKRWARSCQEAYRACDDNNLWSFFKDFTPPENRGYTGWKEGDLHYKEWKRADTILSKIDRGHSGASWAYLMRTLEAIAKDGWVTFVKNNITR